MKSQKTVNVPIAVHAELNKLRVKYITESGENFTLAQTVAKAIKAELEK